jgi:telomere length regulation protein
VTAEIIVKAVLTSLVFEKKEYHSEFLKLIENLPSFDQRNVLSCVLKIVSREYMSSPITSEANQWWKSDASIVAAGSGLINLIVAGHGTRKNTLISWLTDSSGAGAGDGIAIRRAVIAALAGDTSDMEMILDKSLQQFGDQLYIRHTPTLQQEGKIPTLNHLHLADVS